MNNWTTELTLRFIEKYKRRECLWDAKNKDYTNKVKKARAYRELVQFVKTFQSDANRDTVLNKIACLRGVWRKERRKVTKARLEGGDYEPTLFYYERLMFVGEGTLIKRPMQEDAYCTHDETNSTVELSVESPCQYYEDEDEGQEIDDDYYSTISPTPPPPSWNVPSSPASGNQSVKSGWKCKEEPVSERRIKTTSQPQPQGGGQLFASQSQSQSQRRPSTSFVYAEPHPDPHPYSLPPHSRDDEYDCFGRTVAHDLRNMSRVQSIHAKKFISHVLYEGLTDGLSRESIFIASPSQHPHPVGISISQTNPVLYHQEHHAPPQPDY